MISSFRSVHITWRRLAAILIAAFFQIAVSAMGANVLANPGFESNAAGEHQNIAGWTTYTMSGVNTYNETGGTAHSGNNYFKVFGSFINAVNYDGVFQDYISGPGATYSADGWAFLPTADAMTGQNVAWIEVTFRDAGENILALYRSALITTNAIATGAFSKGAWIHLPITNQYDPNLFTATNTTSTLVAPAGTYFARYQVVFQGDATNSGGAVYFDDLALNPIGNAGYGNWNIVWSDEFNGSVIDTNIWTFDLGGGGWGNNELEYYTSRTNNAFVANGCLNIVAQKETTNGYNYTSARMKTQGLVSWQYGRFEWRAKLPVGTGFWPAMWMMGTNISSVNWPKCGEIDVVENQGTNVANVQGSLHSGSDETSIFTFISPDSVTNFHSYVLDWAPSNMIWYVDGHRYERQTNWNSTAGPYPAPFNKPFFMLINMAVGGNYVGNPSPNAIDASLPGALQLDYVRVYNQTPPLVIATSQSNNGIQLSWPTNIVSHLQTQTNPVGLTSSNNWTDVPSHTNPFTAAPTNKTSFFRVTSP